MNQFGDAAKVHWPLEPDMVFLNHGSYGATPHAVLAAQARLRARLEAQPCRFINSEAPGMIRNSAARLAGTLGADAQDIVFCENTTTGINAILKSMAFEPGDEVLVTDHIYNAIRNTLRFVLEPAGAALKVVPIGLPVGSAGEIAEAVLGAITGRTRLLVLDHVASVSAVIFPVAEIAAGARDRDVPVLVDGAHAPGMLELDIPALGVDWYVGNCHKWLCAPKGAAFVWVARERQADLHPTTISHDLGKGFTFEFDKIGTRDASAWLSVPAAIEFCEAMGGTAMRARNHALAVGAADEIARRWATRTGAPESLFGSMATIRMPGTLPADRGTADALKSWLWAEKRAEIHIMPFHGALWARLSVHAYNTEEDCLKLGPLIEAAIENLR